MLCRVLENTFQGLGPNLATGKPIILVDVSDDDVGTVLVQDTDFSKCTFMGNFRNTEFRNVSFQVAVFMECPSLNGDVLLPYNGNFEFGDKGNLNMKNAYFYGRCAVDISGKHFQKTRNYRLRDTEELYIEGDLSDTDLRDFRFRYINIHKAKNTLMDNLAFSVGAWFGTVSEEQICSTWNFKSGTLSNVTFDTECEFPKDVRKMYFVKCRIQMKSVRGVDFSNTKFIDSVITSEDLTFEQVKSTWNYKNDRMDLSKWPEHILKALEAEKETR